MKKRSLAQKPHNAPFYHKEKIEMQGQFTKVTCCGGSDQTMNDDKEYTQYVHNHT